MNGIRCPNCKSVNQLSATHCQQCRLPFSNIPTSAYVSVPVEESYEAESLRFKFAVLHSARQ